MSATPTCLPRSYGRCGAHLDDSNESHKRGHRFGGEVTGKKTPKKSETLAAPRVERTLPLGLWLCPIECAPEGVALEGEEEVEDGAGERDEESDRSSGAETADDLGTPPAREGKDRPG